MSTWLCGAAVRAWFRLSYLESTAFNGTNRKLLAVLLLIPAGFPAGMSSAWVSQFLDHA